MGGPSDVPSHSGVAAKTIPTAKFIPYTEFPHGSGPAGYLMDDDKVADMVKKRGCQASSPATPAEGPAQQPAAVLPLESRNWGYPPWLSHVKAFRKPWPTRSPVWIFRRGTHGDRISARALLDQ